MRNILIFIFYSLALIIIGRQLTFLPIINPKIPVTGKDVEVIREDVAQFIKTQKGQYSIYYEDLISGERFGIQENTVLTAASLNKLGIVGYLYSQASKKEIDLEEKIIIQKEDLQVYGTGSLRYEEPGSAYTLKYLAQLALQKSDNTAAHVLNIRLGEKNIQYYVTALGMGATDQASNETSARNVGYFFEQLYKNKITSPDLTQELLGYMKDSDIEDRIPKYLPKTLAIYHKTGNAIGLMHDGGIIDDNKNPFILVVMAQNSVDEAATKDIIGKIASIVYSGRGNK